MNQPQLLRWEAPDRYRTAMLMPDLFGAWVLVISYAYKHGGGGRVRQKLLPNYAQGLEALDRLRHRLRREGFEFRETSFTAFNHLDDHDQEMRGAEALALLRVFRDWRLSDAEQARVLELDAKASSRLQDGGALPDEPGLLARVRHLLAIHKALRLRFGGDVGLMGEWLRHPCQALGGRAPLTVLLDSPASLANLRGQLMSVSALACECALGEQRPDPKGGSGPSR
jgi:hypothetical protein